MKLKVKLSLSIITILISGMILVGVPLYNQAIRSIDTITSDSLKYQTNYVKAVALSEAQHFMNNNLDTYTIENIDGSVYYTDKDEHVLFVDIFKDFILEQKVFKSGYFTIVSNEGNTLLHPTLSNKDNLKTLDDGKLMSLFSAITSSDEGSYRYTYKNQVKLAYYVKLDSKSVLLATASEKEVLNNINKMKIILFVIGALVLIIGCVLSFYISSRISKAISKLSEVAERISKGDYSNIEKDELPMYSTEISMLYDSFFIMANNSKDSIVLTNSKVEILTAKTVTILDMIDTSVKSLQQICLAVDEIAKGGFDQAKSAEEISTSILDISNEIDLLIKSFNYVDNSVAANYTTVSESDTLVSILVDSNIKVKSENLEIKTFILGVSEFANNATSIIKLIDNIAKNTKLLALNARIEAARAGEHGNGFSVVATEISKMADDTKDALECIVKIIDDIAMKSTDGVSIVADSDILMDAQSEQIIKISDTFSKIKESTSTISNMTSRISTNSKRLVDMKNTIVDSITDISSVTEETSASTEEITATLENEFANITLISSEIANLQIHTTELKRMTDYYKL